MSAMRSFFRKSPYTLPAEEYGGGRKRIFIALLLGACGLVCGVIFLFLILPWLGGQQDFLRWLSLACGFVAILVLAWLCASLVFHIYTGKSLPGIGAIRHLLIRLLFPLMEILAKPLGFSRQAVRRSFIKINNELVLANQGQVCASEMLLLLPHCVQKSACERRLVHKPENCARCGLCPISSLLAFKDKYGISLAIASGGTIARRIVVEHKPKLILAVACERDLTSGIQDSYPLPVFGVLNERPNGPCRDTLVPLPALEKALGRFLRK